jgi:hypothetical protein
MSAGRCIFLPGALSSCSDGVKNGNEEGVDCGGPHCASTCPPVNRVQTGIKVAIIVGSLVTMFSICMVAMYVAFYRRGSHKAVVLTKKTRKRRRRSTGVKVAPDLAKVMPAVTVDWDNADDGIRPAAATTVTAKYPFL